MVGSLTLAFLIGSASALTINRSHATDLDMRYGETRAVFLYDSQALEAGLDYDVQRKLSAEPNPIVTALVANSAQRLLRSPKSGSFQVWNYCLRDKPDIFVLWMGVNELKVQSGQGYAYKADLDAVLASIDSLCGSPKVVLVRPPLFAIWPNKSPEWPNHAIPHMNAVADGVFSTIVQGSRLAVVDAQALSSPYDFDRVGHFCTDKRECQTSATVSAAIDKAVRSLQR